jgi:hypothetical protein
MKAELKPAVLATGSSLMEVHGIRPAAARILADAGDIAGVAHPGPAVAVEVEVEDVSGGQPVQRRARCGALAWEG